MSRFNTPEEMRAWADRAAAEDARYNAEHGSDLNPYCTQGARNDWQRGWDGAGPRSYEGSVDFHTMYQRGAAARRLRESK